MRLQNQIAIILLCWAVAFFYIRWLLSGIISYQLNNSAYKKRKKGMRFKEWFLYSRYREEISKILLLLYFVIVFGHPLMTLVCLSVPVSCRTVSGNRSCSCHRGNDF